MGISRFDNDYAGCLDNVEEDARAIAEYYLAIGRRSYLAPSISLVLFRNI